jgi:ABC-type bacteriocin/lantibiotic exporter with double-glycine peptidase domain
MGRSSVKVITQKNDVSCGPASLKHALEIFGSRKSEAYLQRLCKTNGNGTSTANMIQALVQLGYAVLSVEHATLRHLTSALKYSPTKPRAVIVSYLYGTNDSWSQEVRETGHWATVYSYRASSGRIVLFDSYTGTKKSYVWDMFKKAWKDYDRIRKPISRITKKIKLFRKWQHRLLLIVANDVRDLPKFRIQTAKIHA